MPVCGLMLRLDCGREWSMGGGAEVLFAFGRTVAFGRIFEGNRQETQRTATTTLEAKRVPDYLLRFLYSVGV